MSGAERPALDSEPPSLTHTLGVLATLCEEDESLTPMDAGIRTALVAALRQARAELLVHDGHRQRRDIAATLATTQRRLAEAEAEVARLREMRDADLRERYVLVPRDGTTESIQWGIRMPVTGRVFTEPREPDWNLQDGQLKVRRTHIFGPWEAAHEEAPRD